MQTYLLQTKTNTSIPMWENEFEMHSDDMAIDYSRRHLAQMTGTPWLMGLWLWKYGKNGRQDASLLGELYLKDPIAFFKPAVKLRGTTQSTIQETV